MKKIIHLDADCFYASVEILKQPCLAGLPVAVGGGADRRGVIATCNYLARQFGVHSAMPSSQALKLCPELQILPPRIDEYRKYSRRIMQIYQRYTDQIEPLSLDEAYLDVSNASFCGGSATLIARQIQKEVKEEVGLGVSAGVAPVKFLAKIASDWNKPNGIFVVPPKDVQEFVAALPVQKLPGVGPVTAKKLARYGLYLAGDINEFGRDRLIKHFGKYGNQLFRMSSGCDDREVSARNVRKSISVESTFTQNISSLKELSVQLELLIDTLHRRYSRLEHKQQVAKRFIKIKFSDFSRTSAENALALNSGRDQSRVFAEDAFHQLLTQAMARLETSQEEKPIRLLGVGLRFDSRDPGVQLSLPL